MMYVLTQEELDNLVPMKALNAANAGLEWVRQSFVPRCMHFPISVTAPYYYCSECPLSSTGKNLQLTHGRPTHEISKVICPLRREYPK